MSFPISPSPPPRPTPLSSSRSTHSTHSTLTTLSPPHQPTSPPVARTLGEIRFALALQQKKQRAFQQQVKEEKQRQREQKAEAERRKKEAKQEQKHKSLRSSLSFSSPVSPLHPHSIPPFASVSPSTYLSSTLPNPSSSSSSSSTHPISFPDDWSRRPASAEPRMQTNKLTDKEEAPYKYMQQLGEMDEEVEAEPMESLFPPSQPRSRLTHSASAPASPQLVDQQSTYAHNLKLNKLQSGGNQAAENQHQNQNENKEEEERGDDDMDEDIYDSVSISSSSFPIDPESELGQLRFRCSLLSSRLSTSESECQHLSSLLSEQRRDRRYEVSVGKCHYPPSPSPLDLRPAFGVGSANKNMLNRVKNFYQQRLESDRLHSTYNSAMANLHRSYRAGIAELQRQAKAQLEEHEIKLATIDRQIEEIVTSRLSQQQRLDEQQRQAHADEFVKVMQQLQDTQTKYQDAQKLNQALQQHLAQAMDASQAEKEKTREAQLSLSFFQQENAELKSQLASLESCRTADRKKLAAAHSQLSSLSHHSQSSSASAVKLSSELTQVQNVYNSTLTAYRASQAKLSRLQASNEKLKATCEHHRVKAENMEKLNQLLEAKIHTLVTSLQQQDTRRLDSAASLTKQLHALRFQLAENQRQLDSVKAQLNKKNADQQFNQEGKINSSASSPSGKSTSRLNHIEQPASPHSATASPLYPSSPSHFTSASSSSAAPLSARLSSSTLRSPKKSHTPT